MTEVVVTHSSLKVMFSQASPSHILGNLLLERYCRQADAIESLVGRCGLDSRTVLEDIYKLLEGEMNKRNRHSTLNYLTSSWLHGR